MYRSVFIFQKRGNLSCCECLCVFLYMREWKMESDTPFISKFHMFVFTVQLFFLPPLFSSYVVKWLKPFYNIAHVKATKRQKKKDKKKTGKKKSFSILKEKLKALNYTEHLPLSRPASVGAGRHCTA